MKQLPPAPGQKSPHRRVHRKASIPREFAPLVNSFALDAQDRMELWVYALVLLMIDEEQVRLMGTHEASGQQWVTVQIYSGDEFEIVKPALSQENEHQLLEGVRRIVKEVRASQRRVK
jgi:hypothetical protein